MKKEKWLNNNPWEKEDLFKVSLVEVSSVLKPRNELRKPLAAWGKKRGMREGILLYNPTAARVMQSFLHASF